MKAPLNLTILLPFLATLVLQGAAQVQDIFNNFGRGITKELPLRPIGETILAVGETPAQVQNIFNNFGRGFTKEIAEARRPIDETIFAVGETHCSNVKKLLGVDYDQVAGLKEPNLNELTLLFRSRELNVEYHLSSAARLLTEARGYNPRAKLIIYIHGFTEDLENTNFISISEAFLKTGEYNILGLDASSLIRWLYLRSTTYVRFIGERLGEVLAAMVHKGLSPDSIHLIGHSLGSHIAGFTGKQFTNLTGMLVGRISGLDPAGPCFTAVDPELRLKATDAQFVDAIHTNSGVLGINERVGHADFFPNGGSQQPSCLFPKCSHSRVNQLYAESITKPEAFLAKICTDYDAFKQNRCREELSIMGYSCPPTTRGAYYLRTGDRSPYGLGRDGARWNNNDGFVRNIGINIHPELSMFNNRGLPLKLAK